VSLIARGPHLKAIREQGLEIRSSAFGNAVYRPFATADPAEIGPVDYVVLAVKAQALTAIAPRVASLCHEHTVVVTTQNGIPWWYFHGCGGEWQGARLESIDPGGVIAAHIEMRRVIGCIAYCSGSVPAPGVVEHVEGLGFTLGEPDGSRSERIKELAGVFRTGGLKAPIRTNMRHEIWVKLLGNATFNPISALARATLEDITRFAPTRELAAAMMEEVRLVARAVGIEIEVSTEQRIAGASQVGRHKTSMLQDLEAGRSAEIDPLLGAVIELAGRAGVATPHLSAVYACTKLLFESAAAAD
jgi:2-dehydropantoate 2-reductase